MTRYHINQATGEARRCMASIRTCPVGGAHFENVDEANNYIEESLGSEYGATTTMTKPAVVKPIDPKVERTRLREEARAALDGTPGLWRSGSQVVSKNKIGVKFKNGFTASYNRGQTNEDFTKAIETSKVLQKLNSKDGLTFTKDKKALNKVLKENLSLDDKKAEMLTDIVSSSRDTKAKRAIIEKLSDDTNDALNELDPGSTKAWKRYEDGDYKTPLRHNSLSHYLGDEVEAISQAASPENADTVVSYSSIKKSLKAFNPNGYSREDIKKNSKSFFSSIFKR